MLPAYREPTVHIFFCILLYRLNAPPFGSFPRQELHLQNRFLKELPGETFSDYSPRVVEAAWAATQPTPPEGEPRMVVCSTPACSALGIDPLEADEP